MAARFLLPLAVAASCTALVVGREPEANSKSWVSFPITHAERSQTISRRDSDVPLYNISSVSYLIQLSIGTPGQSLKVAIDTGSDELWVNPNCTSSGLTTSQAKECQQDGSYTSSKSSTATKLTTTTEIQYGKGDVELAYVKDSISLPDSSLSVKQAQFGVATESEDLDEGILGLGWGNGKNLKYNTVIDELAAQNATTIKAFSVALGSVTANNGGVLIFGGVDTKKFTGSLVTNKILGPQGRETLYRYWIQMTSVALTKSGSSSKTYSGGNIPVVLDSGSSLSYLPNSIVKTMASDFSGTLDKSSGLYLVPCTNVASGGTVDFTFGSAVIKVPFSEFIWQYDSNTCILGAVPIDSTSAVTPLLGDTFMRSAFVVFDQTNSQISMAQYANCGENEQALPSTGASGIAGACTTSGDSTGSSSNGTSSGTGSKNAAGLTACSNAALAVALLAGVVMTTL